MSLRQHLVHLENSNLIGALAAAQDELAYVFRHALIQDAAYSSLLRLQRAQCHQAAAAALEDLHGAGAPDGGLPAELAPILAHHHAAAGNAARALHYYTVAGEAAAARYANLEAADHFGRALDLALDHAASASQVHPLFLRLGRALELVSQLEAALQVYARMEAVALQRGDRPMRLAALMARATLFSTASFVYDADGALAALEQARPLARELDDHAAEVHINWTLLLRNTMTGGDPHERLRLGEAALRSARALGLREQLAYVLTDIWYAYAGLSQWSQARQALLEAHTLWRGLTNPAPLSETLGRTALTHLILGEYGSALESIAQAHAVAEQMDSPHMRGLSRAFAGPIHIERGEFAPGLQVMHDVIALGQQTGNVTGLVGTRAELALAFGFLGDVDAGLALTEQAIAVARDQFPLLLPWASAAAARLLVQRGDLVAAEQHLAGLEFEPLRVNVGFMVPMWAGVGLAQIEAALCRGGHAQAAQLARTLTHTLTASTIRHLLPEALTLLGRALLASGDLDGARSALDDAHTEAQAIGARRHLWMLLAARSAVEEAARQPALAAHWRRLARLEVDWLSGKIPSALLSSFLARPAVAALVASPSAPKAEM